MNTRKLSQKIILLGLIFMLLLSTSCAKPEVTETAAPTEEEIVATEPSIEETEPQPTDTSIEVTEPPPTDTPTVETEPPPTPTPAREDGNIPPIPEARMLYDGVCQTVTSTITITGTSQYGYVNEQILITGNPELITAVVEGNFDLFSTPGEPIAKINLPEIDAYGAFEIHLYQLADTVTVGYAISQTNQYIMENGLQFVFAEPNYVTALPGRPAAGGTPETSANPCPGCSGGINGNPCPGCSGGINGNPTDAEDAAISAEAAMAYAQGEFLNQWAFGGNDQYNGSIGLYQANEWVAKNTDVLTYTGKKIDIAVFDTVPAALFEGHNNIFWASVPFDLCVMKPGVILSPDENPQGTTEDEQIPLQEHGLFVTGLAQGVAPAARFTLIEVLNEQGKGDVASLIFGMTEFAKARQNNLESLNNTVINLSLGLELERFPRMPNGEFLSSIEALRELLVTVGGTFSDTIATQPFPSVALSLAMTAYEQNGAVIVAAAGNDHGEPAQSPAAFPDVLGVYASDIDANPSCFSNEGDIAAPGGNGDVGASCDLNMIELCSSFLANIGDCPHVVISILSENPALERAGTERWGFGFWAGTSMSTPLVSGLAALLIEQCPDTPPEWVRDGITSAAFNSDPRLHGLGAGVIQVGETIALDCPLNP